MGRFDAYYVTIQSHTMSLLDILSYFFTYYAASYSSNPSLVLSARLEAVHTRQEGGWKSTRHRTNTPTY